MMVTAKIPQPSVQVLSGLLREMMRMSRVVEEFQVVDLLAIEDHHLKMVGRDVGVKLWVSVPAEVNGDGAATVDIAKFNSVLSAAASSGEVKLVAKTGKGCLIQAAGAKWKLSLRESMPVDEKDMVCDTVGGLSLQVLAERLKYVTSVMPSATSVAAEHYRTCVVSKMRAYGTDGVIAATRVLPKEFGELNWTLSRRAAEFIVRIGSFGEEIKFGAVDQGTSLKFCCYGVFSAVLVLTKPARALNTDNIVKTTGADFGAWFAAQRDDMLTAIRLTEPTNSDHTRAMTVRVGDKVLLMNTKDMSGASQATLDLEDSGPGKKPIEFSDKNPVALVANADMLARSLSMMGPGRISVGVPPSKKYLVIWDEAGNNALLALMAGPAHG